MIIRGKFIGNNGIGSEIRIINSNTSYKEAISNIPNNTKLLTDFSYCVDNEDNIKMLLRIVDCYAYEAGVRQDIDSKFFNESQYKDVAAGYNPKGGYLVAIYEPDGSINKDYQDYNNV
jgi:hypothetical protein